MCGWVCGRKGVCVGEGDEGPARAHPPPPPRSPAWGGHTPGPRTPQRSLHKKNVRFWGGEARGVNMLFRSLKYGWKHPGGGFTVGGKARGALTKAMRRLGAPAREHAMSDSPSEPLSIAVGAIGVSSTPSDGCARVGVDRPPRQVSFSLKISPRLRYVPPRLAGAGEFGRPSF